MSRHSDVTLEGNNPVTFTSNTAEHGGAVLCFTICHDICT